MTSAEAVIAVLEALVPVFAFIRFKVYAPATFSQHYQPFQARIGA